VVVQNALLATVPGFGGRTGPHRNVDIGPFRKRLSRRIVVFDDATDLAEDTVQAVEMVVGDGHPAEVGEGPARWSVRNRRNTTRFW
jgi:hypothetical protein